MKTAVGSVDAEGAIDVYTGKVTSACEFQSYLQKEFNAQTFSRLCFTTDAQLSATPSVLLGSVRAKKGARVYGQGTEDEGG